jgi:hypothetical protein
MTDTTQQSLQHLAAAGSEKAKAAVEHRCNWNDAWPTGHPLPPEDPEKLQGPEVGTYMLYHPKYGDAAPVVVRVIQRSYVWSPGECRSYGGHRHYDWSVIEEGPDGYRSIVVNDEDLSPLPTDRWSGRPPTVRLAYSIRI